MFRDIIVKTKRLNLGSAYGLALLSQFSACGLTNRPDHCMLDAESIYSNGQVDMSGASLVKNRLSTLCMNTFLSFEDPKTIPTKTSNSFFFYHYKLVNSL